MDVQRRNIHIDKSSDYNERQLDNLSFNDNTEQRKDNDHIEQLDFYKSEAALNIFTQIISRENNTSVKTLSLLSLVNKELNAAVQWRLNLLKKIYSKYKYKFGQRLYKKLINHPFEYDSTKSKVIHVSDMTFGPLGLGIFNLSAPLFDTQYMVKNKIALTNVCLLSNSPEEFEFTMCVTPELPIIRKTIYANDYVDLGEITPYMRKNMIKTYGESEIDHPGRYFLDLNLATKNNPIILSDEFVAENRIYFKFMGPISKLMWSAPYIVQTFPYFIAHFKTVSSTKYNWTEYGLSFNGAVNTHARTTSLIRPRTEIIIESQQEMYVNLPFWFNRQTDHLIPSHVIEYLESNNQQIQNIENYSVYNTEYDSEYESEYNTDYESDLDCSDLE